MSGNRPYPVDSEKWERCTLDLFPKWLEERGGIVVYECHMLDSSHLGSRTYMPARYEAEDGQMHDAPDEHRPNGGLPSLRQQKIDHIKLEDFGGDVGRCIAECFVLELPPEEKLIQPRGAARERWRVLRLDVWGNAEEGWEVNEMYAAGHVETGPEPDHHELFEVLRDAGHFVEGVTEDQLEFTGDDEAVGVGQAEDGYPLFYLEYVGATGEEETRHAGGHALAPVGAGGGGDGS